MSLGTQTLNRPQQQQDWKALEWASEEMNEDREIVMAALKVIWETGWPIKHVPKVMLAQEDVALAAIRGYKGSYGMGDTDPVTDALIAFLPDNMKRNECVRKAAGI